MSRYWVFDEAQLARALNQHLHDLVESEVIAPQHEEPLAVSIHEFLRSAPVKAEGMLRGDDTPGPTGPSPAGGGCPDISGANTGS